VSEQQASVPVVVVGAGIVGAATTYFLTRSGVSARLVDASAPAAGATGAADGAVSVGSKRPGPMMDMARAGLALYRELAEEGLFRGAFQSRPTFLVAKSQSEADVLSVHREALTAAGSSVHWLDRAAIRKRVPALSADIVGVLEVENEGHAVGYDIVSRLIRASGLVVERLANVSGLELDRSVGRVSGVRVGDQVIAASAVVVAAGGGAGALVDLPGVSRPRRGQQLVTERAPALNASLPGSILSASYLLSKKTDVGPSTSRGYGVVIDPLRTGQFLIGSTREEGQTSAENDIEAVAHLAATAREVMPALGDLRVIRCFAGVRTAMRDGLPMVGRISGIDNLYVAAGFEGDGICLGPLTGRIVANLVQGHDAGFDISPFDPARFSKERIAE
jgi:glycine/D-amino acid oxidase-like deaminating enzyme